MNCLDLAISEVGGVAKLAAAVGVVQGAVSNWRKRGSVPPEHCAAIEAACGRKVTRRELRPDDWRRIWPELIEAAAPTEIKPGPPLPPGIALALVDRRERALPIPFDDRRAPAGEG